MGNYRGSIAGFLGGTIYAIIFSYLFSVGQKYSINFLEFVSIAMLVISPISVGTSQPAYECLTASMPLIRDPEKF